MKRLFVTTALAAVMSLPAMASHCDIPAENVRTSSRLSRHTALSFENGEFTAHINGTTHKIDALDVRGLPEDLQEAQLKGFLAQGGYLQINPLGEEDYSLEAHMRGLGRMYKQVGAMLLKYSKGLIRSRFQTPLKELGKRGVKLKGAAQSLCKETLEYLAMDEIVSLGRKMISSGLIEEMKEALIDIGTAVARQDAKILEAYEAEIKKGNKEAAHELAMWFQQRYPY